MMDLLWLLGSAKVSLSNLEISGLRAFTKNGTLMLPSQHYQQEKLIDSNFYDRCNVRPCVAENPLCRKI